MNENDICEIVRRAETSYIYNTTKLGKYVDWSMHNTIETIDAYLNSKHTSGKDDSLGREKPFFNIVSAATNIWYRATDIDRKDIKILPESSEQTALAFVATVHLQDWMTREKFGQFLNLWGRSLARYGSTVVKFIKQGGRLIPSVIPWNRLIVDPTDFDALPVIEKLYLTPAQLLNTKYDKAKIKELLEAIQTRKNLDKENIDTQSNFIELYEVHGEMSRATYNASKGIKVKEGYENDYFQQMHVVSFVKNDNDTYSDFTLFSGKETQNPYMITHLIEEDGRTLAIGAVEYLFDAQWMQNHTIKAMRDYLDLASKIIFQTSDSRFVGRNILDNVETGEILNYSNLNGGGPLTQVSNSVMNMGALIQFSNQWKVLEQEITATPDSQRGVNPPSNQPYSTTALLNQSSNSLFELMTENKGLAIEEMLRTFVIPFLKTKMNNSKEIAATLESHNISQIDAMYIPREAIKRHNQKTINTVLSGGIPSPYNQQKGEADVKQQLATQGNMRSFVPSDIKDSTWNKVLKDLEWTVRVEVTNEQSDKNAVLGTLNTALTTISGNPYILQNPNAALLFSKILSLTGAVSPMELASAAAAPIWPHATLRETMDFADLPPDGKVQLAEKAGLTIQPPAPTVPTSQPIAPNGGSNVGLPVLNK